MRLRQKSHRRYGMVKLKDATWSTFAMAGSASSLLRGSTASTMPA